MVEADVVSDDVGVVVSDVVGVEREQVANVGSCKNASKAALRSLMTA